MNTEFEDRLRGDMESATRGVYVPPGLALKAYRHNQKRRTTLRVATAFGAAATLAAVAVAVAGVSGAFGSAPPQPAQTTAYVLRQVESALAPANIDNLVSSDRIVFSLGVTLKPVVGGLNGGGTTGQAGPAPSVGSMLLWQYHGTQKYSAYSPSGQHVFDMGVSITKGSSVQTAVIYANSTWWTATATATASGPGPSGCVPAGSIVIAGGPGHRWPAFIRAQLSCGAYVVTGHQVVDGIDAIKITGDGGRLTLLVNPVTYLPVQLTAGPMRSYFQWLSPTPANLAPLKVTVPAGFQQVAPPTQK